MSPRRKLGRAKEHESVNLNMMGLSRSITEQSNLTARNQRRLAKKQAKKARKK